MIRGLIFDFDGLILNTEEAEYAAWEEIFQSHGGHLPVEDWALSMGMPADEFDVIGLFERQTGQRCNAMTLKAQAHRRFYELLALEVARPGVEEYLRMARSIDLAVALATSSGLAWVKGHLTRMGLWDYFDVVCTCEDVAQVKPDPELFQLAAARLQLSPQETIVFEDSPNGILAAKAAGCYTVAVPHKLSNLNGTNPPDRVIQSLADVPLAALVAELNRLLE